MTVAASGHRRHWIGEALVNIALLAVLPMAVRAEPPAIEAFSRKSQLHQLKLSPDGRHVAALADSEKASAVLVLELPSLRQVGGAVLTERGRHFTDFWWSGDRGLIAELSEQLGTLDEPRSTGELVGFELDGKRFRYLLGQAKDRGPLQNSVWATVADPLVDDPDHVLVQTYQIVTGTRSKAVLSRMSLRTLRLEEVAIAPAAGEAEFLLDPQGRVRYVVVETGALVSTVWQRSGDGKRWLPVAAPPVAAGGNASLRPLAFAADGESVFLSSNEFGPQSCLTRHVLASGERIRLACDDAVDLSYVITAFTPNGEPIAAVFEDGKPDVRMFGSRHPHAAILAELVKAFAGREISISSATRDGRKLLVLVGDDRTPGDYFLFDTEALTAEYFPAERDRVDADQLGERRPIRYAARDGTTLHGYLTLPPGVDAKQLPLVVMPHGGPLQVRDHWRYDEGAQLLASHGYAVLQVNFRGSGGYGDDFVLAGRRAWATTMIDDIDDGVAWVLAQGYADPGRLCIAGASYGAFAAITSAIRNPDRYRCVIAEAGVYDLNLLRKDSSIADDEKGRAYFTEAIAAGKAEATALSPITHIAALHAPVLIIHGESDERTPLNQAKALRTALKVHQKPFEWLIEAGEGHGFWKDSSRLKQYQAMLDFLERHLTPPAGAPPPSP